MILIETTLVSLESSTKGYNLLAEIMDEPD